MNPLVSLIVTSKNSARTIEACLRSAREQQYQPIELVVVDNASSDDTPQIARRNADIVIDKGPERSAQRNAGIGAARGEYVLVLDADMVLERDVVAAAVEAAQGGAAVVAIPEVSFGQGFWSACKTFERAFYARDPVVSAGRFFSRQAALDAGGYDETLTGPEDWDLSMRLAGSTPIAFARARILHDEGRQTLSDLFRKKYYYGRSLPAFVRKHGSAALKRLNPARSSLIAGIGEMFKHPLLACGMIVMKSVEAAGGTAGMLDARPRDISSIYRATGT
ncbi:MAG: glycosyltransferase family 2 protein [Candidatus Eremiobacteraeota bacterium]|nr:glycosyltransferase family 2 protein [Candidatus Eremiobacteraeota bacterium]